MRISCNCQIKTKINTKIEIPKFNKIVYNIFKHSEIGVIKCYKLVFNWNKKNNIGFWIFLFLILIQIPFIIYYIIFKDKFIQNYIKKQIIKLYNLKIFNPLKKNIINKQKIYKNPKILKGIKFLKKINYKSYGLLNDNSTLRKINNNITEDKSNNLFKKDEKIDILPTNIDNSLSVNKVKKIVKKKKKFKIKNMKHYFNLDNNVEFYTLANIKYNMNFESLKISKNNYYNTISEIIQKSNKKNTEASLNNNNDLNDKNISKNNNFIIKLLFYSNLYYDEYQEAVEHEKRAFLKVLYSMVVLKVKLIKIFLYNSPIELKCIFICLVIFIYSCNFALNTLFYFSSKISDKYHYKGKDLYTFTLINNISICLISTFMSIIIVSILTYFTNSKKEILHVFKQEQKKKSEKSYKIFKNENAITEISNILINLRKKVIIFFVIELTLLLFFFYFTTAFCEVYVKTQKTWITDCSTSFLLSIFSEILISCIATILYRLSLKNKINCLYKIMKLLL